MQMSGLVWSWFLEGSLFIYLFFSLHCLVLMSLLDLSGFCFGTSERMGETDHCHHNLGVFWLSLGNTAARILVRGTIHIFT